MGGILMLLFRNKLNSTLAPILIGVGFLGDVGLSYLIAKAIRAAGLG